VDGQLESFNAECLNSGREQDQRDHSDNSAFDRFHFLQLSFVGFPFWLVLFFCETLRLAAEDHLGVT